MQKEKAQLRKQVEKVFGQRIIDKYSSQQLSGRILKTTQQSSLVLPHLPMAIYNAIAFAYKSVWQIWLIWINQCL